MTRCRIVEIDGQPVRVRGDRPMTPDDQAAFTEVIRAAKRHMATLPPAPVSVECPTCGAQPGAFCRKTDGGLAGRVTAAHTARREAVGQ